MISTEEMPRLQVGYKQAVRALNEDKAEKILVAEDSDNHIRKSIEGLASQKNTPVFLVPTMKELGGMCSIEVGASCAVILK